MVDDDELRRRLELLREKFEDGKIVIAEHLAEGFKESFGAVKAGPDGEIDLSTVDGRVRSTAMAVAMMEDRESTNQPHLWQKFRMPIFSELFQCSLKCTK